MSFTDIWKGVLAEDRAWEETRELGTGSPRTWGLTI